MLNPSERNLILFPTFLLWLSFISMKFRVTAAPLTGLDSFNTSGSTLGDNPIYRRGSCFSKLCNGEEGYPTLEDIQHALKPGMPLRDKAIFYIQSQEESPLGRNTYAGQHNLVDVSLDTVTEHWCVDLAVGLMIFRSLSTNLFGIHPILQTDVSTL